MLDGSLRRIVADGVASGEIRRACASDRRAGVPVAADRRDRTSRGGPGRARSGRRTCGGWSTWCLTAPERLRALGRVLHHETTTCVLAVRPRCRRARGSGLLGLDSSPPRHPADRGIRPSARWRSRSLPAAPAVFEESVEIVGTLDPKFSADVKSEVTGTVRAVYVTEWVPVRKGALLAQLDTTETEAGIAALKAVEAQARVARDPRAPRVRPGGPAQAVRPDHAPEPRRREDGRRGGRGGDGGRRRPDAHRRGAAGQDAHRGAHRRRRRLPRHQRRRSRREHGRQWPGLPDRRQPAARPHGVDPLVPARGGAHRPGDRVHDGLGAGPDVHGQGQVHQPGDRRGQPLGEGRGRGAERATAPLKGGAFVKGRVVVAAARTCSRCRGRRS